MKSATEAHRLFIEAYGVAALREKSCREWFQKFRNCKDKERSGRPKSYKDTELETLLEEDRRKRKNTAITTPDMTKLFSS